MRRKEKEIIDISDIEHIIHNADVCRVAMSDNEIPYLLPMNFGYENMTIYLHTALEGRKIDILRNNPNVCVEFEGDRHLITGQKACDWTMTFSSVIGTGKAFILENPEDKIHGLNVLMKHYSGCTFDYNETILKKTNVIRIDLDTLTGKQSIK